MLTGELRNQIDRIWDAFWSGGVSNPLEVIEQITCLLFLRRLDDLHTLEENKSSRLRKPMERRIFPEGKDARGRAYEDLRWSRFKHMAPAEMYTVVGDHVFPFLRMLGGDDSTYARHMKDARFTEEDRYFSECTRAIFCQIPARLPGVADRPPREQLGFPNRGEPDVVRRSRGHRIPDPAQPGLWRRNSVLHPESPVESSARCAVT